MLIKRGVNKMSKNYPKWEDIYTRELTLQALFEKLIDVENALKDRIFELERRLDKEEEYRQEQMETEK